MEALICRYCGGNLHLTGEFHCICDSCGSHVTLPKLADESRALLFNRGNHFRSEGLFDKAYSAYEHIIAQDPTDAEAHWCLTLCRYGIEYIKDERTGEYKPTIGRMQLDSILEDPDYLDAVKYSDEDTAKIYRTDAEKIHRIQNRLAEIVRREKPVDVFICFKETDENRKRTNSSIIAQDIYERLTEEGLNVFFSRLSLEGKIGDEYEPYIFAALNSARVMLVVANHPDQLQSRWVRNEWSRFLSLQDLDSSKILLPVFQDMRPEDLPREFNRQQGQDMKKLGAMENLTKNVLKLVGETPMQTAGTGSVQVALDALLNQANRARVDQDPEEAKKLLRAILKMDPKCVDAYLMLFYMEHNIHTLDEIMNLLDGVLVTESVNFLKAKENSTGTIRQRIDMLEDEYRTRWKKRQAELRKQAELEQLAIRQAEERKAQRQRMEEQAFEADKKEIDAYRGTQVLRERMRQQHPAEYVQYTQLFRELKKTTDDPDFMGILNVPAGLIFMLVMTTGALLLIKPLIPGKFFFIPLNPAVAYIAVSISFLALIHIMSGHNIPLGDLWFYAILAVVLALILGVLNAILGNWIRYVILILVGIIDLMGVSDIRSNKAWRICYRRYAAYRDHTILPLSRQIRHETAAKFEHRKHLFGSPWTNWELDLDLKHAALWELEWSDPDNV